MTDNIAIVRLVRIRVLQQNEQEYYNELQECLQSATHTIHGLSGLIRQSKKEAVSDSTANNKSEAYKSSPLTITIGIGNQTIAKSKIDRINEAIIETVTVIDFETANHSFTSACSIGIVVIKGTEVVDRQYYLIQPPNNFYTNDNALADAEAAAQLILCNLAHSKFKSAATFLSSNSSYLKDYDDVKIQKETEFKRYNRVDVNEIAASTTVNEEKDADFNGKTFVITGEFKTMTRKQALEVVVQRGGIIKNSVSSKVDILVNADDRTSIKTEKAAELQAAGHHIKVINEEQFMRMLESNDAIEL